MIAVDIFKHILPRARAWRITFDKILRQFFEGLAAALITDTKENFDNIYSGLDPQQTNDMFKWEAQFGLNENSALTEQQRRDRLDAAWKETGGQSPGYIQDTLRNAGFDVYVHEWWVPGSEPGVGVKSCVTPINPNRWLRQSQLITIFTVTAGNPTVTCGNPEATCGASIEPYGYPLVNKINETVPEYFVTCGNPAATCGNPEATCGNYSTFKEIEKNYTLPLDPDKWAYFLYIGGETFGDLASIDLLRKDEFENLCLKVGPLQLWLGMLVKYE